MPLTFHWKVAPMQSVFQVVGASAPKYLTFWLSYDHKIRQITDHVVQDILEQEKPVDRVVTPVSGKECNDVIHYKFSGSIDLEPMYNNTGTQPDEYGVVVQVSDTDYARYTGSVTVAVPEYTMYGTIIDFVECEYDFTVAYLAKDDSEGIVFKMTSGSKVKWWQHRKGTDWYWTNTNYLDSVGAYGANIGHRRPLRLDFPYEMLNPERFRISYRDLSILDRIADQNNPDQPADFGHLCLKAAESIRCLDINSIAFVKDFIELSSFVRKLASFDPSSFQHLARWLEPENLRTLKHSKTFSRKTKLHYLREAGKQASNLYLAGHYGLKLTFLDTQEIANSIDNLLSGAQFQRMGSSWESLVNYWGDWQFYVKRQFTGFTTVADDAILRVCDGINDAIDQLKKRIARVGYEVDLLPTTSNLWDMVPFSFVADWFVPIGSCFEAMETKGYLRSLPVLAAFYTSKYKIILPLVVPSDINLTGKSTYTADIYVRRCKNVFELPRIRISDFPSPLAKLPNHWLESAALIISNN